MEKQKFVVEVECETCGGLCGAGMVAVREAADGDKFGSRQMTDDEIPAHLRDEAGSAHPADAIVVYRHCDSCRYDY